MNISPGSMFRTTANFAAYANDNIIIISKGSLLLIVSRYKSYDVIHVDGIATFNQTLTFFSHLSSDEISTIEHKIANVL